MLLAVVLQIIGASLVLVAVAALTGVWFGILACGLVVFAAGFVHERDRGR